MIEDMAQYRFRPGQSGNPAGRIASPHLRKLKKLLRAKTPKAMKALDDCLEHRSHKVRLEALKLWFLYAHGKPQEFAPEPGASEFVHRIDASQFSEAELVAMEERARALSAKAAATNGAG